MKINATDQAWNPATVQSLTPPFSFLASLKSRRLSMRLLAVIGGCSLLCILLAIAFQLTAEYRRDLAGIESRLQFIESSYVPALTAGAYQMDEEQIRLQLRGVLQLQDIVYARVREQLNTKAYDITEGDGGERGTIEPGISAGLSGPETGFGRGPAGAGQS